MQIGFRRALTVGCGMWASFIVLDLVVIRYLNAGRLSHFLGGPDRRARGPARRASLPASRPQGDRMDAHGGRRRLVRGGDDGDRVPMRRVPRHSEPLLPGMCLVLLSRTVTLHYQWKRGLVMTGSRSSSRSLSFWARPRSRRASPLSFMTPRPSRRSSSASRTCWGPMCSRWSAGTWSGRSGGRSSRHATSGAIA